MIFLLGVVLPVRLKAIVTPRDIEISIDVK